MAIVYIGVGSNLGDGEANCRKAAELLGINSIKVLQESSSYETEPWGVTEQPRFINAVFKTETELCPEDLLRTLNKIEADMGRERGLKWGPRIIDLDILFYEDLIIDSQDLSIPHPLLDKRDFVLLPLSEIAAEKVHPSLKKTVGRLKKELIDGLQS